MRFVFWKIGTSVFYSIIRKSNYSRPKVCCFFDSVSCVFLLHVGLFFTNLLQYANLLNSWKQSDCNGLNI